MAPPPPRECSGRRSPPQAAAGFRPHYVTSRVGGPDRGGRRVPEACTRPDPARPVPAHVASAGSKSNSTSGLQLPHGGVSNELGPQSPAQGTLPPQPSRAGAWPPAPPTTAAAGRAGNRNPREARPALFSRELGEEEGWATTELYSQ